MLAVVPRGYGGLCGVRRGAPVNQNSGTAAWSTEPHASSPVVPGARPVETWQRSLADGRVEASPYVERENEIGRARAETRVTGSPATPRPAGTSPTRTHWLGSRRGARGPNNNRQPRGRLPVSTGSFSRRPLVMPSFWRDRATPLDDFPPQPHDVFVCVHAVAVDRVTSRLELPAVIPAPERGDADAQKPGCLGDRDEVRRLTFAAP
jgi:hypothetical protein